MTAGVSGRDEAGSQVAAKRFIFLCLDTLGDQILRQPLFKTILDAGHEVFAVMRRPCVELAPYLDRRLKLIEAGFDPYQCTMNAGPGDEPRELIETITRARPDVIVSPLFNRTPLDEVLLRSFPAHERVGFRPASTRAAAETAVAMMEPSSARAGGELFTLAVEVGEHIHECDKNEKLLTALLGRFVPYGMPTLQLDEASRVEASSVLATLGLAREAYALACPIGGANVALKAMHPEQMLAAALEIERLRHLPTLLIGIHSEEQKLRDVARQMSARGLEPRVWTGADGELGTLLGLIEACALYVGCDTGPTHAAAALGKHILTVYGGGTFPRFLPRAQRAFVATQKLPCFGCGWDCVLGEPVCISAVPPAALAMGLSHLLETPNPGLHVWSGTWDASEAERVVFAKVRAQLGHLRRQAQLLETERDVIRRLNERVKQESAARAIEQKEIARLQRQLESVTNTWWFKLLGRKRSIASQTTAASGERPAGES